MTRTWPSRRTLGALAGSALVITAIALAALGSHAVPTGASIASIGDRTMTSTGTERSVLIGVAESRPVTGMVEPVVLAGIVLLAGAALLSYPAVAEMPAIAHDATRRRRWRAQLVGAPPVRS